METCKTNGSEMKNKILAWFGLTTIKRAKSMSRRLFDFYVEEHIKKLKIDSIKANLWWCMEYDRLMKLNSDNVIVTNKVNSGEDYE